MKKADSLHRILAKGIDFLIVGGLSLVPFVGVPAGILYILISDGFFNGRSVGKKLIGLSVTFTGGRAPGRPCDFRGSMVRNLLFGVVALFGILPLLNLVLFPIGLLLVLIETYFLYFDDQGIRVGDIFAQTKVSDDAAPADSDGSSES